ncbi:G1/S-specific cyclin-E isoform X2 [Nematostella vectensis]|uniref:G1/S-specific cyclin-E isoform X2 n=1 Tax=Nematostella vectensis TaxID=45351 RepID=UPI00138FA6A7|nr:G1/S-specific cyclin-E isoform X2 [Nematostella vectensis]
MASSSASTNSKQFGDRLGSENGGKRRKRKVKDCNSEASFKRSRSSQRSKKLTNQTLCRMEGSISAFSRIDGGRFPEKRVLQEITSEENIQIELPSHKPASNYTFSNFFLPVVRNISPLPDLGWADSWELWSYMLEKDRKYTKDHLYLRQHPHLQPRMRAILLDWLIEVCEVYRLHRETYFLAVDFVDRYLSVKKDIPKQRLQLVGTTALFIAAKLEEIYPPKLSEFAYVTDGACKEDEILQQELLMLQDLNWKLCPITSNTWLNIYMQLHWLSRNSCEALKDHSNFNFVIPRYSQPEFIKVSQLLDICSLDIESLQFSYSVLAAAAMYHVIPVSIEEITCHKREDLSPCIQWMGPFAATMRDQEPPCIRMFDQIKPEDSHNIQTHIVDLGMLDIAQRRKSDFPQSSPVSTPTMPFFTPLTPPSSTKKS